MELRWIVRHYGEFKDEPVLQYRKPNEDWKDVPTTIVTMSLKGEE
jgi:hypothetical protein